MRSRGVFEFRTPPSDFFDMGGEVRLLSERGHTYSLCKDVLEVMTATNAGYSEEMYRIACRVWCNDGVNVWDWDYHLRRHIEADDITLYSMSDMYDRMKGCLDDYTPVKRWDGRTNGVLREDDFREYARRILERSGRQDAAAWTFLYHRDGFEAVLYVRTVFLEWTRNGRDILNYVYMVRKAEEYRRKILKYQKRR